MPRNPKDRGCPIGSSGNLPQYKASQDVCYVDMSGITMPGIRRSHFKEYHIRCPFDTYPPGIDAAHLVRNENPNSSNYWNFEVAVPPDQRATHTTTSGIMARWSRGSKHGWLCVDDNCPYHSGITVTYSGEDVVISEPGDRYFYF